jgi:hypothetical protein
MEGTSLGGELVLVSACLTVSPLITGGQAHTHTHMVTKSLKKVIAMKDKITELEETVKTLEETLTTLKAKLKSVSCDLTATRDLTASPVPEATLLSKLLVESVLTIACGSPSYEFMLRSKKAPQPKEANNLRQATKVELQQICYDWSSFGSNQRLISANPDLAEEISGTARRLFEEGQIKVCLDDPGCGYRMTTVDSTLFSSWPRSENINVRTTPGELSAVKNMSKESILRAGLRKHEDGIRVCTTLALFGSIAIALSDNPESAPPIIADLVPGHKQTVEFDQNSGSTSIDKEKSFAKPIIKEALVNRRSVWIEGNDGMMAPFDVIHENNLIVEFLGDEMIGLFIPGFTNVRAYHGREDDHFAMLVRDVERGHTCLVFTCMQIASTISSPFNVHRAGNFGIAFLHEWIRAYLVLAGAQRHNIFPPFTTMKESLLHCLLTKSGAAKITRILHENNLVENETMYKCSSQVGGEIGAKSSHRTDDGCEKGQHWIVNENRLSTSSSMGESSRSTSKNGVNQFYLVGEIDSKNK